MKAFTLIEVLVAMVIFILLITAVFALLLVGEQSWHTGSGLLDLQQQARLALDGMAREMRQAEPATVNIDDGLTIEFKIKGANSLIKYSRDNQNRIIRKHDDKEKILAQYIEYLEFEQNESGSSPEELTVKLRAYKIERNRELRFPLQGEYLIEKVRLRNE